MYYDVKSGLKAHQIMVYSLFDVITKDVIRFEQLGPDHIKLLIFMLRLVLENMTKFVGLDQPAPQ